MTLSTQTLELLPSIRELKKGCQSIAMLDAILEPEWELRYYSFNSKWDKDEELASMRDGEGSFYFILFNTKGAVIKGYDPESLIAENDRNGITNTYVLDSLPYEFKKFLSEPAFNVDEATFYIWRKNDDKKWHTGSIAFPTKFDPDGSKKLLFILDGDPNTYKKWAEDYHEVILPVDSIEKIYNHEPLTQELLRTLNSNIEIKEILDDIKEINYPYIQ